MKLVDTNVLGYAVNSDATHHRAAISWLDTQLSGNAGIGLGWLSLIGFVRISSNPRAVSNAMPAERSMTQVQEWLSAESARLLSPTARHPFLLRDLLAAVAVGGNLVNNAHLAALAIEHRAEIVSYDTDFARFPGVRWSTSATA